MDSWHASAPARCFRSPSICWKDLTPVAQLTTAKLWLVGCGDLPPNNLKELIGRLKANPDKATGATIGAGSGTQLCLIYLQQNTGTRFQLVPYRGTAPIFTDLLAGHVDLTCPEAGQRRWRFTAAARSRPMR